MINTCKNDPGGFTNRASFKQPDPSDGGRLSRPLVKESDLDIQTIKIGLFGDDAPAASKYFLKICEGTSGVSGLSYDGAQVSSIVKDKKIEVNKFQGGANLKSETYRTASGATRIRSVDLAAGTFIDDTNKLSHDASGIVSMKRGGGNFGFTVCLFQFTIQLISTYIVFTMKLFLIVISYPRCQIAPSPNKDLDEENIVIGKVISGLEIIDRINSVPTSREDVLGTKGGFKALASAGGDGRGKIASVNRPLQKVRINSCRVDEKASLTNLMKF